MSNHPHNLSQEEIDALVNEIYKDQPKDTQLEFELGYYEEKPKEIKKFCFHEWVEYLGFNVDKYLYCKHCGEKKV